MDRERERGYAGSPNLSKKVTWKEPIEQHVSVTSRYRNFLDLK